MNQIGIPVELRPEEVAREKSLGGAIGLCLKVAGHEPKEVMGEIKTPDGKPMDKAQWSRWESGQEGVMWPKLEAVMDYCGNDAPVWWMLYRRGYDLHSLRRLESQYQRELRIEREARQKAEERVKYFEELMTGRRATA